jgi:hypothetical protein
MKKARSDRKLTLHTETIRHMKHLTMHELGQIQGGSGTCSGEPDCTSTKNKGGGGPVI